VERVVPAIRGVEVERVVPAIRGVEVETAQDVRSTIKHQEKRKGRRMHFCRRGMVHFLSYQGEHAVRTNLHAHCFPHLYLSSVELVPIA
jgi:hypothetical protein